MSHYESIAAVIHDTETPTEAKEAFLARLAKVSDVDLAEMADLIAEEPALASRLVKNFQAKQVAFALEDSAMWDKIVKAEEFELGKMEEEMA
jgi:hypothetical protein